MCIRDSVSTTQAAGEDSLTQEKLVPLSNGYEFNVREARDASVVHLRDSIYVVAYAGESGDGFIQTFSVSEDGKRMSKIDEDEHDGYNGWDNSLVKADDNTVVLAYRGLRWNRGVIKTFTIDSDGKIKEEDDLTHDNSYGNQNSLIIFKSSKNCQSCISIKFIIFINFWDKLIFLGKAFNFHFSINAKDMLNR